MKNRETKNAPLNEANKSSLTKGKSGCSENECSCHDNEIFIESGNDNGLHISLLAFIRIVVGTIILSSDYGETTHKYYNNNSITEVEQ